MSLELQPGVTLPIPCRKCGKIAKWALKPGKSMLRCKDCDRTTEIVAAQETDGWSVRTGLVQDKLAKR